MKAIREIYPSFRRLDTKSREVFFQLVKQHGCTEIEGRVDVDCKNGADTETVGTIGDWEYSVEMLTTDPKNNRQIVCRELVATRKDGSSHGIADAPARQEVSIRTYLHAEKMVEELQKRFPSITVRLIGPNNRSMKKNDFERLHADARKVGLISS